MTRHEVLPGPIDPEGNHNGEMILQAFSHNSEQIISSLMENKNTSYEQRTTILADVKNIPRYLFDRFYEDHKGDTFEAPLAIDITTKHTEDGRDCTLLDIAVDVESPRLMDGNYFTVLIPEDDPIAQIDGYETVDGYGNHATISDRECRDILTQFAVDSNKTTDKNTEKSKLTATRVLPLPMIISTLHEEYQHYPGASFAATLEEMTADTTSRLAYDYNSKYDALQLESINNWTREGIRIIFRSVEKYSKPVDKELSDLDPFPESTNSSDDYDTFVAVELFNDNETKIANEPLNPRFIAPDQLTDQQVSQILEAAKMLGIDSFFSVTSK